MDKTLQQALEDNSARVEAALDSYTASEDGDIARLTESQRYSLLGGGKRIRPFLAMEFCRMHGGDDAAALPFACALEMIHTYSLIHDDLPCMDDDDLRRGKPTNHKVFGEASALLAGDALLTCAFEVAATNPHVSEKQALAAVKVLAACAGPCGMIGGQEIDLRGEGETLPFPLLLKLHALKTGAMIQASAILGCLAAGLDENSSAVRDARAYAKGIGLAFQIVDDILDACSTEEELGKSTGGDATHQKTTFLRYFDVDGARDYARRVTDEAIGALRPYAHHETLEALAVYLLHRTF